tara:strand:- start:112 stop:456 length:345 start_codon:yes stop_codon:yes gene_type:complete
LDLYLEEEEEEEEGHQRAQREQKERTHREEGKILREKLKSWSRAERKMAAEGGTKKKVADTEYYNLLNVSTDATDDQVRKGILYRYAPSIYTIIIITVIPIPRHHHLPDVEYVE